LIFDLSRLKNKIEDMITIDLDYQFQEQELAGTDVIAPLDIHVNGFIKRDILDGFELNARVIGTMNLPCSVTLKPVSIPFEINIDGNLEELLEEIEEIPKKSENSIDILPIIWENILMEIPMKVTSPDAVAVKTEGEGWKFVTETKEENEINPAFAKLKDLL